MAIGATGFGFTGIAPEVTKGTALAATHYIPVTRSDPTEATSVLLDQGMRGSMATVYGAVKGTTSASYDIEGDVYVDTIGFPLVGIMGADATTLTGPFLHTITLSNTIASGGQCPSYTIWDFQGLAARKYAAATCSSLSLRLSAQELLTYSASFSTFASVADTTPTPTFSALSPVAGWVGTVNIAGGGTSTIVEEAEINFSRNVSVVHTIDGTANPSQIWQGPLSVSGRMTLVADAETEFARYTGVTLPSLVFTFAQGTASLVITMTSVTYTDAKIERGEDYTQTSVQFEALANTTDAGVSGGLAPCKVLLTNAFAASAYD